MTEFKGYHPFVNFLYFVAVIIFSMLIRHPISLLISIFCGLFYATMLKGKKTIKMFFTVILPLMVVATLINPIFVHEGITIITYFPNGKAVTLESLAYGFTSAIMIASAILWFSCHNEIMTNDKIIYLFGKTLPSVSLIISLILRFVPRFKEHIKLMIEAQKGLGENLSDKRLKNKIKTYIEIFSAMITWALENSIETANSMKNRGYGLCGRSAFHIFRFEMRDFVCLIYIMVMSLYIAIGYGSGNIRFSFYPQMLGAGMSIYNVTIFLSYFLLCIMPIVIEIWEGYKWKYLRSKI